DAARRIIRRVGVETGGANNPFARHPAEGRLVVLEMKPRGSRASAPPAKGPRVPLPQMTAEPPPGPHPHDVTDSTPPPAPASVEPTIEYVVVKIPRWNFEKFPQADRTLTTQMKSVGEAMAIGRTFKEAFMKGVRSLELGKSGLLFATSNIDEEDNSGLRKRL